MYRNMIIVQEHSSELSSLVDTLDRLDDSIHATKAYPLEDVSTESSSAFLRMIGVQRPFKVDKLTLVNHLDGIYYDIIKSTYTEAKSLMTAVKESHGYFKGHLTTLPEDLKFDETFSLELDRVNQQTLHISDKFIDLNKVTNELERFLEFFVNITDYQIEDIFQSINDNSNVPDAGYGLRILKNIPKVNKLMNNLTVTWEKKQNKTLWKSKVVRTRSNVKKNLDIDQVLYRKVHRLFKVYIEAMEKSLEKSSLFILGSGPNKDKEVYKLISGFYAPIFLCVIRNLFLMSEMMVLCRDNVKGVMR